MKREATIKDICSSVCEWRPIDAVEWCRPRRDQIQLGITVIPEMVGRSDFAFQYDDLSRELLIPLDNHIAVQRIEFHQERPASGLLSGDRRGAAAAEEVEDVFAGARGVRSDRSACVAPSVTDVVAARKPGVSLLPWLVPRAG